MIKLGLPFTGTMLVDISIHDLNGYIDFKSALDLITKITVFSWEIDDLP